MIPPVKVSSGGFTSRTEPLEFSIFNPDDLQWSEVVAGDTRFRYASAFRVLNPRPYNGETVPVEIKIYVPADLRIEDWGIPDFQRDGVTAWRFQPSAMRGQVNLLGTPCVSVAYPSTLTPTRTGAVGIGPATVRLMTVQYRMDGIGRNVAVEANLSVPGLELEAIPLPAGAPADFENAVGDFKIESKCELTEVQEGDPIPVEIVVSGSGNLDTLRPPKPVDVDGWKLYDASIDPRGDERREVSGTTVFRQFLRPLELKTALPAFQMVLRPQSQGIPHGPVGGDPAAHDSRPHSADGWHLSAAGACHAGRAHDGHPRPDESREPHHARRAAPARLDGTCPRRAGGAGAHRQGVLDATGTSFPQGSGTRGSPRGPARDLHHGENHR